MNELLNFKIKWRINRLNYIIFNIKSYLIYLLILSMYFITPFLKKINNIIEISIYINAVNLFMFLFTLLFLVQTFCFWIRRLHDLNINWIIILIFFIPWFNLILLLMLFFKKWTKWKNDYWDDII